VSQYAYGLSEHPVPSQAVGEAVGQVLERLGDERPDLVVLFASPHHVGAFEDVASSVRGLLDPTVLLGGTAGAVIGGGREVEDSPALSLFAARLPATLLTPVRLEVVQTPDGPSLVGWPDHPDGTMLLLADPFTFPADAFLDRVNEDLPKLQIIGGLASAAMQPGGNRLVLDDQLTDSGAVGAVLTGGVEVRTVVSQGCRPVGKPYVVTKSDRNFLLELGGKPALQRLQETATSASDEERELMRRGLQIGCVVDETRLDFGRGDFLVRGVGGAGE
jgi:small ligand-binding sensory domain FIST